MVKIRVRNVSSEANDGELRELFEKFGTVTECDIIKDFAFVHMNDEEAAKKAVDALDRITFAGQQIHVAFSQRPNTTSSSSQEASNSRARRPRDKPPAARRPDSNSRRGFPEDRRRGAGDRDPPAQFWRGGNMRRGTSPPGGGMAPASPSAIMIEAFRREMLARYRASGGRDPDAFMRHFPEAFRSFMEEKLSMSMRMSGGREDWPPGGGRGMSFLGDGPAMRDKMDDFRPRLEADLFPGDRFDDREAPRDIRHRSPIIPSAKGGKSLLGDIGMPVGGPSFDRPPQRREDFGPRGAAGASAGDRSMRHLLEAEAPTGSSMGRFGMESSAREMQDYPPRPVEVFEPESRRTFGGPAPGVGMHEAPRTFSMGSGAGPSRALKPDVGMMASERSNPRFQGGNYGASSSSMGMKEMQYEYPVAHQDVYDDVAITGYSYQEPADWNAQADYPTNYGEYSSGTEEAHQWGATEQTAYKNYVTDNNMYGNGAAAQQPAISQVGRPKMDDRMAPSMRNFQPPAQRFNPYSRPAGAPSVPGRR